MVILKTPSQVNSFVKRMTKEYEEHHVEGCGCCGHNTYVESTPSRVILISKFMNIGYTETAVRVLAILKGRAR